MGGGGEGLRVCPRITLSKVQDYLRGGEIKGGEGGNLQCIRLSLRKKLGFKYLVVGLLVISV